MIFFVRWSAKASKELPFLYDTNQNISSRLANPRVTMNTLFVIRFNLFD